MNFASVKAIEAGSEHGQGLFWTVSYKLLFVQY
jgi:hypothetical protein